VDKSHVAQQSFFFKSMMKRSAPQRDSGSSEREEAQDRGDVREVREASESRGIGETDPDEDEVNRRRKRLLLELFGHANSEPVSNPSTIDTIDSVNDSEAYQSDNEPDQHNNFTTPGMDFRSDRDHKAATADTDPHRTHLNIAVEGCCHGELDTIYRILAQRENREGIKIDLLLICGDFESIRVSEDLMSMAVPQKYRKMNSFQDYYTGKKVAPIPTIFIGGNHEASNVLQSLYYGGYVAPNIYFLGMFSALVISPFHLNFDLIYCRICWCRELWWSPHWWSFGNLQRAALPARQIRISAILGGHGAQHLPLTGGRSVPNVSIKEPPGHFPFS
jgi:hypothetical protein